MAITKRGQTWSLRFRPFGGDVIGLATLAKTKFEAQGIEREILLACRARDYSCLSKESREACLRMFRNQGWEPPPGLVKTEPDKLTLRRAFEIFAQSLKVKNDPGKGRHEISQFHFEDYFGSGTNIESIWVPELEAYQAKRLADGRAPGTINREMVTMSKLFTVLEQHRMIRENPVRLLSNLPTKGSERQVYISFQDVSKIAEAVPAWFAPLIWTGYYTGMRRGEILTLTRDAVDLNRRMIHLGAYKTKEKAKKRVPIHRDLVPILSVTLRTRLLGTDNVFLLQDDQGVRPVGVSAFKNCWPRACEALQLPDPRPHFHDLRGTFKTNFVQGGGADEIAERIMGHSNKALTVAQRYGYLSDDFLVSEVDKLTVDNGPTRIWVERLEKACTKSVQGASKKEKLRCASKL